MDFDKILEEIYYWIIMLGKSIKKQAKELEEINKHPQKGERYFSGDSNNPATKSNWTTKKAKIIVYPWTDKDLEFWKGGKKPKGLICPKCKSNKWLISDVGIQCVDCSFFFDWSFWY